MLILRKLLLPREFLWISTPALKSRFLGFWILASSILLTRRIISSVSILQWISGKASPSFPDFNLGSFFTFKNIFIIKNPTDFGKTVEIGSDPFQPNCPLNLSLQCLVECWRVIVEVELFYYELLRLSLVKVERLQNNCLRL